MAGTQVPVRFKRAWQNYRVGDQITPNGTLRDWLVAYGYVDIVEAETPGRPARIVGKAKKVLDAAKKLL